VLVPEPAIPMRPERAAVSRLHSMLEPVVVLGIPISYSVLPLLSRNGSLAARTFTPGGVLGMTTLELAAGGFLLLYLGRRGWRAGDVSLAPERRDVGRGLGVWLFTYLVIVAAWLFAWAFFPALGERMLDVRVAVHVDPASALLASLVNPLFEEGLWLAYVVNGPGRARPLLAALLSVGARTAVHAYQGWAAVWQIAPLGAWFLRYYRRTRRLTPILLAHGIQDLLGLLVLSAGHAPD